MPEKSQPKFYAVGKRVFKSPVYTKTPGGQSISMGFPVCDIHDAVEDGEKAATAIAKILCENEERL